jgi:hypothetical protein
METVTIWRVSLGAYIITFTDGEHISMGANWVATPDKKKAPLQVKKLAKLA